MIIGLAPGLKGANRTGRPFTGDYAGDLLYATLRKFGLATGEYDQRPDDGLTLDDALIVNAVRCVPPQNKPTTDEIRTCRQFLDGDDRRAAAPRLSRARPHRPRLAAGRARRKTLPPPLRARRASTSCPAVRTLFDSYHCSRYNTNTGVLTTAMFEDVVGRAAAFIRRSALSDGPSARSSMRVCQPLAGWPYVIGLTSSS